MDEQKTAIERGLAQLEDFATNIARPSKAAQLRKHLSQIDALQERNVSLYAIAQYLTNAGFPISVEYLSTALNRIRTKELGPKPRARKVSPPKATAAHAAVKSAEPVVPEAAVLSEQVKPAGIAAPRITLPPSPVTPVFGGSPSAEDAKKLI